MAITALEYLVIASLRNNHFLPPKPKVLELGKSNWYGDISIEHLARDIPRLGIDEKTRDTLIAELRQAVANSGQFLLNQVVEIWLKAFADPAIYSTIDPGTPGSTYQFDLNLPVPLEERFDITMNIGTAEHIFNVNQFFKTAHDRTVEGGLMIHTSPFTGWPDHGFYNFQPTFFYDLARANRYEVMLVVCAQLVPFQYVQVGSHGQLPELIRTGKIPPNSNICVVLRKGPQPAEFAIPIQGYYAGTLTPEAVQAWRKMR